MKFDVTKVEILLAKNLLTQDEFARRCDMTRQNMNVVLRRGTCQPKTLGKIARALDCDVEQLIAKEGVSEWKN